MHTTIEWWRIALLIVMMAGLLIIWWTVNRGRIDPKKLLKPVPKQLKILERHWINSKLTLVLIEVDGQRYVLAQTSGHVSWLPLAQTHLHDPS